MGVNGCALPPIPREDLEYARAFIERICSGIGPGSPCSPQERARAAEVKAELAGAADSAWTEDFECAPGAFYGSYKLGAVLSVIVTVFFYFSLLPANPVLFASAALALSFAVAMPAVFEFTLFKESADFLFRRGRSENVIGAIGPARRNAKAGRIVVFGGHHDSALKSTYLSLFKHGYYAVVIFLLIGSFAPIVLNSLRLYSLLSARDWRGLETALLWMSWTYLPVGVFVSFTFTERPGNGGSVPGAMDNLSAVAILLLIGRALKRNPELVPPDTEVRLISFGCEEAGVRGSRAYVRAHADELAGAEVEMINFETIFDPKIVIFRGDRNGTMRNSRHLVRRLEEAARRAGVPFAVKPFPFGGGGTDAIPFREKGINAACLFGMKIPADMVRFYHQPSDDYGLVNTEALGNAARIALEYLRGLQNPD